VSSGLEHRECFEAMAAYALGALPEGDADRVRRHLTGCRECRVELEWLRPAIDALPASVTPLEPPTELKARVMEIVQAEAELLSAAGEPADRPRSDREPLTRRVLRRPRLAAALGLAVACVAAVVIAVLAAGGGSAMRTIPVRITDAALAGHVQASLRVQGAQAQLQLTGLPVPPADHVDQVWVEHGAGATPQSAGTFVVESGAVRLSRAVRPGDLVLVTVEPGGGSAAPTSKPLLVARL
jgi:anti-sigma-K factor RskA